MEHTYDYSKFKKSWILDWSRKSQLFENDYWIDKN
jgi:hypothetical protein